MARDIQPLYREPSQMGIQVRRDGSDIQPKPFRHRADKNTANQFHQQGAMAAAEAGEFLSEQELTSRQCAQRRVGSAISDDFLTAEHADCVGICEHAEDDSRVALRFFIYCCLDARKWPQSLGFFLNPGRQSEWINPATQLADKPGHFFQANDLAIPADSWLLAHYARFMDLRFHTRCYYDRKEWQFGDDGVTNV